MENLLKNNYKAPCTICKAESPDNLKMDNFVKDVNYLTRVFGANSGSLLNGNSLKVSDTKKQHNKNKFDGAVFVTRVLRQEGLDSDNVERFEYYYDIDSDRKVDIYKVDGVLIECKSWKLESVKSFAYLESFNQFLGYLGKIKEMADLEYWFDKNKISSEDIIKEEFKGMFYKKGALTTKGKEVFEVIWKNNDLRESLFGGIPFSNPKVQRKIKIKEFTIQVENISGDFYNFIKVK